MPHKATALDVCNYERQELGNSINVLVSPDILSGIPSSALEWLTETMENAAEYGDVSEVDVEDGFFTIIAEDNYGGKLVYHGTINEKPKSRLSQTR